MIKLQKPDLNKPAFTIFPDKAKLVRASLCALCEEPITSTEFKDDLSRKEYGISGMCQACQDKMWA